MWTNEQTRAHTDDLARTYIDFVFFLIFFFFRSMMRKSGKGSFYGESPQPMRFHFSRNPKRTEPTKANLSPFLLKIRLGFFKIKFQRSNRSSRFFFSWILDAFVDLLVNIL